MNKKEILEKIDKLNNTPAVSKGSSAVIIPLIEKDGEMHILFEERSHKLEFQPGEVCFPGGRIEEGETPKEAALREFFEELFSKFNHDNIPNNNSEAKSCESSIEDYLEILSELPPIMGPTGAIIYPFVGLVKKDDFTYSKDEVEKIFTYPVSYLLDHPPVCYKMQKRTFAPDNFPFEKVTGGKSTYGFHVQKYDMWIYEDTDPIVWGFTGRLLHSFLEQINSKKPAG
ncbi:CoA pyrophosphatase [Butyrivibrio sp. INlla16]|uniref:NUDIX hydrolase n=1 Tax=Butyrivibrio sp. INlla16 TaxID=1520807 RepID=UPI000891D615|nr:CoA pyrophosphatase [Butyrivibrio sp. INlla16]SDB02669.1 NUDIX domain-containing protein [Butyrivibrio sp. INlla16]